MENLNDNSNFIWDFIDEDLKTKRYESVHTRFPPEPNGYLHIGHCKALCTNFGTAEKYNGLCNLRFDDTNPSKEDTHFVEGIMEDIHWLGFDWNGGLYYASDYYQKFYDIAVEWIKRGLAYVCQLTPEQAREYRGTLTSPGKDSPYRNRPIEESLKLFDEMKNGVHPEGSMILRAKIDMSSPNMNMRDPAMYRILYTKHHRTGNTWCIYPMYDYAHPLSDAFEGITHSLCSLEFQDHRPLYDWVIEKSADLIPSKPRQIEFARLNLSDTVMSKRYLRTLVEKNLVMGWDDPRMPTICGMRRRGFTPESIKSFISKIGLSKADSEVEYALLEHCVREDLSEKVERAMAVIDPLEVELVNWDENKQETLVVQNHPNHPEMGTHEITISKHIYIEKEDFMENPIKKFFRLSPEKEVRLKDAYIVKCIGFDKDHSGEVIKVYCELDFDSKSGTEGANRKVKGTLHWVDANNCVPFEARIFEGMLDNSKVDEQLDYSERFNHNSMIIKNGYMEKYLEQKQIGDKFQFLRQGYFCKDSDSSENKHIYNKIVGLRDSFAKQIKN